MKFLYNLIKDWTPFDKVGRIQEIRKLSQIQKWKNYIRKELPTTVDSHSRGMSVKNIISLIMKCFGRQFRPGIFYVSCTFDTTNCYIIILSDFTTASQVYEFTFFAMARSARQKGRGRLRNLVLQYKCSECNVH